MKKSIFCFLFFVVLSTVQAQERYIKCVFSTTISNIKVQKWKKSNWTQPFEFNGTYFLQKKWGIGISCHNAQLFAKIHPSYQHPDFPIDIYAYVVPRYLMVRTFTFLDLPIVYRLLHKRHSIHWRVGFSFRRDTRTEIQKDLEDYFSTNYNYVEFDLGYCASLAYQFRVYRNFGLSADVVLRQSKDIPTTLSYGVGLTYSIFNKKKEK
ncbi:MAG: hypothetical protein EAZ95_14160 [Bacteroidetes bacterium]|nr:MAG: hypothetical protein EAZ95_14160 [Bacteroidota bacterium]